MRVLVTGAKGQLGKDIIEVFSQKNIEIIGVGRAEMDVTSLESVNLVVSTYNPDIIIHCAAYTMVDLAETERDQAFLVNVNGTRNMAVAAEGIGAKFCYISTDYVFDGKNNKPYNELDIPNPLSVYGRSKLYGEEITKELSSKYFIVRTSWVFGAHGNNFVKTMLKLAKEKSELNVINDQKGSPTYSKDLALFLFHLLSTEKYGIYHVSNTGSCSWYEFAKTIFDKAGITVSLVPIQTKDYHQQAPRPHYSVMDNLALRTNGFKSLRHWEEALNAYMYETESNNLSK